MLDQTKDAGTQPNNFGFGENEVMLRDSVKKFFKKNLSTEKLHRLVAGDFDLHRDTTAKWDKELWQQMVELGWTGLAVPEAVGGIGMSAVAVASIAEEAGRAALPSPLIPTLCSTYVLKACKSDIANSALESIANGSAFTLAITNQRGSWEPEQSDVTVNNNQLTGTAYFVQDAQKVDAFIVSAKTANGVALYLVNANAQGLTINQDAIVDLTRDQAHLDFDAVEAKCLTQSGSDALIQALPALLTIVAADMVGAAEWQLQTTTEYAKMRKQFERQIGFFQAVKHPLVNLMTMIDQAKSLVYNAACAIDHEPEKAEQYARMANSMASDMADFGSGRSVQLHGGIGFTWECFVHIYFKRQMHNQFLYGDGKYQRSKLADMILGSVA